MSLMPNSPSMDTFMHIRGLWGVYLCDVSSVGQSPVESVNVFQKQNPENSAEYFVAPKTTKVLCSFEVTLIFTFQTQKKRRRKSDQAPRSGGCCLDCVCLQHSEPAVTCSCFVGSDTKRLNVIRQNALTCFDFAPSVISWLGDVSRPRPHLGFCLQSEA